MLNATCESPIFNQIKLRKSTCELHRAAGRRRHTHTHTPLGEKLYPANAEAVSRSIQRYCGTRICVFCKPKINSR
ncbi:unnamed protein product [Boreogadus saida]